MAENKALEHLPEVRAAVAALSPEDRKLLAAVQASPFKLTAPEQFKEFAANIDYFVFEPNIHDLNDLGWRYLAQHMDMLTFWTRIERSMLRNLRQPSMPSLISAMSVRRKNRQNRSLRPWTLKALWSSFRSLRSWQVRSQP